MRANSVLNSVTASLGLHVTVVLATWEAEVGDQQWCGPYSEAIPKEEKKSEKKNVQVFWVTREVEGEDNSGA